MSTNKELRWKFFTSQPNPPSSRMSNSMALSNLRDDNTPNRRNERPSSGPEIDDLEPGGGGDGMGGDGIDDGLLPPPRSPQPRRPSFTPSNGGPTTFPQPVYPNAPASPGIGGFVPGTTPGNGGRVDINVYAQKKTLAQGMMDLALLSAIANQLRYVLDFRGSNPYFYVSVTLISMSLLLQISVGIGLILNSRYNIKHDRDCRNANRINNFTIIGIFLVMIINAFITAFAVTRYERPDGLSEKLVLDVDNETVAAAM